MTIKDFISKVQDSYIEVAINEYSGKDHTGNRVILGQHACVTSQIPEEFLDREISGFVLYYDRISIEVERDR